MERENKKRGKNIIICCDGTGNQYGERNSNVVKLYSILDKQSSTQIAYYDPGIGTLSDPRFFSPIRKKLSRLLGYAFGAGLTGNIAQAYSYLMEQYEEGDQVYLFGFSRGAYTVRVLAGFIHMCGLLQKGCQNLIPYAWKLYKKRKFENAGGFKSIFARECKIHFLGVWDTVSSIGWIHMKKTFPFSANNEDIAVIRHALSIDERRAYYRTNLWGTKFAHKQDIKQVWFAGVHSDVGGSYPEEECRLSKIPLKWMADEARHNGLHIDERKYEEIVLGENDNFVAPDYKGMLHKSLRHVWWIPEFIPKNYKEKWWKFYFPRGRRRIIPESSIIHQSVIDRINDTGLNYSPEKLSADSLENFAIEPYRQLPITETLFFQTLDCPSLGWEKRRRRLNAETDNNSSMVENRMTERPQILEKAREYYPGGVMVRESQSESAAIATAVLMNNPDVPVIYGAVFLADNAIATADILVRDGDKWRWIKVGFGSYKPESKVDDKYIKSMAYTTMVMQQCDVDIIGIKLLLISGDFRLGMNDRKLFCDTDCTEAVLARTNELASEWNDVRENTEETEKPEPEFGIACRECDFFSQCIGAHIQNPIFDIPDLTRNRERFERLKAENIIRIEDIDNPSRFGFSQRQTRVINSVKKNEPEIGENLSSELEKIKSPVYYLDFESVITTIPLFPDTAPFDQVLTQYSIHKCIVPGKVDDHFQYLADHENESRRELAERLIRDLGNEGSIIVYSGFEQRMINQLIQLFPDLSNEFDGVLSRLVDLEKIIKEEFYHPDFHGKTSIKKTLPALVKDMSYKNLAIRNGSSAAAVFAGMVRGEITGGELITARENLLIYCKQDTLAMVKLHEELLHYTR